MLLRLLGSVLVGASTVLGTASLAYAQGGPPPEAEPESAAPPLVIVADVSDNATQNSQIRAILYEVAREHGYDAAGKLDVEGTAANQGLMQAGAITSDPGELERLRGALKVAVLVRISKDADQGGEMTAHIRIMSKEGMLQKVVSAARGAPQDALRVALDSLLPHVYKPKAASTPSNVLPPTASGALLSEKPPPDKPFDAQQTWQDRGGFRATYGAVALISALHIKDDPWNADQPQLGKGTTTGIGGGVGVRVGFIYMPIPDPTVTSGTFVAFRGGVGFDTDFFYARHENGLNADGSASHRNQALWVNSLPFELGIGIAGGHFIEKTSWKGVIVGVSYAPAVQFRMDLKNAFGEGKSWLGFNPAGVQVSVDITKMDVKDDTNNSMQIRLLAWGLLPMDVERPGFASIGVGAIWY
jgi:hypothetical protein